MSDTSGQNLQKRGPAFFVNDEIPFNWDICEFKGTYGNSRRNYRPVFSVPRHSSE